MDLTGQRFGHLTVLGFVCVSRRSSVWTTKCDCGEISLKSSANLPRSIGCSRVCPITRKSFYEAKVVHGMTGSRPYRIWSGMIARCHNPRSKDWPRYGSRGISVCASWKASFESFWADMGSSEYGPKLTIDRIDNDKGYCKENCRWVTARDNCINKRNSIVTKVERQIADANGITKATLGYRIRRGWSVEDATTIPANKANKIVCG